MCVTTKTILDEPINSPLQALSKMVPVPESLMSPDYRPSPILGKINQPLAAVTTNNKKVLQTVRSPKLPRNVQGKNKTGVNNEGKKSNSPSPARIRKVIQPINH